MLGSAWEWLVGFLATTPDAPASASPSSPSTSPDRHSKAPSRRSRGPASKASAPSPAALWLGSDWDVAEEMPVAECIPAEEGGEASLDSLLVPPRQATAVFAGRDGDAEAGVCEGGGGLDDLPGREEGAKQGQEDSKPSSFSTWQSLGLVAAAAFSLASDEPPPPPPLLEHDNFASPPRRKSVRDLLVDSAVCQTTRESEAAAAAAAAASSGTALWQGASQPKRETSGDSPKSVFDPFWTQEEPLLPPQSGSAKGKRTLVLDLDETLVHSVFHSCPGADFALKVQLEQGPLDVFVLKRPGVDAFLKAMAAHYEIVVFTASVQEYADPLLDILDPEGLVAHRLFRDSCSNSRNGYAKDLARLGRDLSDTIIIDNSPHAYIFQPDNALPILSYYDDACDTELEKITPFLESLSSCLGDARQLLSSALGADVKNLLQARLSFLL